MEEKKILWIVAALGIFLLVIFLGTLIIYSPENTANQTAVATVDVPNGAWVTPQPIIPQQNQGAQPITGNAQNSSETTTLPLNTNVPNAIQAEDLTVISQGTTTVYSQNEVTTIDLTNNRDSSTNTALNEPVIKPVTTRVPSTSKQPEATVATPTPAAQSEKPKAETPKVVEQKKPQDQYWVQAASYVSKSNAENARSILEKQKIPAEVFTHSDANGITYYRVRVGPYTTKSEAEYWNSLIKTVDSFADSKSYVTNSSNPVS